MDPLTLNWPDLIERVGVPMAMCLFMAVMYVKQSLNARDDRKECAKDLRQLRSYTDRSLENMRKNQNAEREKWLESINALTHDLTNVLDNLLEEMKIKREQEEKAANEIIEHIDRVIGDRNEH